MSKSTSFLFDEQTIEVLTQLQRDTGSASKSETVRKALALLKVATEAVKRGDRIVLKPALRSAPEREILIL